MTLVDTSVWIDHFRRRDASLVQLLDASLVPCHPVVIGGLACGHLRDWARILHALGSLACAPVAAHHEAMLFLDRHALAGCDIGWLDVHLLASTALAADARLWMRDKPLASVAAGLGMAYVPA